MRVITGKFRGTKLFEFDGREIRPTTEKVKEAIFSSIHFELDGAKFLDLFSGTGQMGIEAVSRGAKLAYFVEKDRHALDLIKKNVSKVKMNPSEYKIVNEDAFGFMNHCREKFNIVFLDPPYRKYILSDVLVKIPHILEDNAIIICEHETEYNVPTESSNFTVLKEHKYGSISTTSLEYNI